MHDKRTTWGWVNDRIIIFGWTTLLKTIDCTADFRRERAAKEIKCLPDCDYYLAVAGLKTFSNVAYREFIWGEMAIKTVAYVPHG